MVALAVCGARLKLHHDSGNFVDNIAFVAHSIDYRVHGGVVDGKQRLVAANRSIWWEKTNGQQRERGGR